MATRISRFGTEIEDEGFTVVPIRMRRRERRAIPELLTIRELIGLFRHWKPDIVHNVGLKPVIYGSIAARLTRTAPVINTLAGMGYVFTSAGFSLRMAREAIKLALRPCLSARKHWLIVQNDFDASVLVGSGLAARSRTTVIRGSGVNTETFKPAAEPAAPVVAAIVSRMLKDKGVREVVAASRELKRRGADVEIWLVGDPDPENPSSIAEETLRQWHDEGVVRWLGHKNDIAAIWATVHIALLPSYREGMPLALLEAAACGRPIVASDIPGCNDLVTDGETGLLVPSHDWKRLADAIEALAQSPDLRARIGAAARRKAVEEYSQEKISRETIAVYREALAGPLSDDHP